MIYDIIREQIDIPNGVLFHDDYGQLCVRVGNSSSSLEDYLSYWDMASENCKDDIIFLIHKVNFSFEGFHNAGKHIDKKNSELQKKLEVLIKKMAVADDPKSINNLYNQISQLINKMHAGYLTDSGEEQLHNFINDIQNSVCYGKYRKMASGLHLEMLKEIENSRKILPQFVKAYVDSIYEWKKQKIFLETQAKNDKSHSLQSKSNEREKENEISGTTSVDDTTPFEIEKIRSIKHRLISEESDLIKRRNGALSRKDVLLQRKTSLIANAEIKGLFEIEYYEIPIYREYPNPVDGEIAGYKERSRYKNGTDKERKEHQETLQKIEQELQKVNEEIEVLSENIDSLSSQIDYYEKKEHDTLHSMRSHALRAAEERFFGMSKLQQVMAKLSGKKALLKRLQESEHDLNYEQTMREVESIGGMFR